MQIFTLLMITADHCSPMHKTFYILSKKNGRKSDIFLNEENINSFQIYFHVNWQRTVHSSSGSQLWTVNPFLLFILEWGTFCRCSRSQMNWIQTSGPCSDDLKNVGASSMCHCYLDAGAGVVITPRSEMMARKTNAPTETTVKRIFLLNQILKLQCEMF